MKKEIAEYIEGLTESGKPLTDVQAKKVAYWEYVDFQGDIVEPEVMSRAAVNRFLKGIRR